MGLVIDAIYDSSVTSAPNAAGIERAINAAVQFYENIIKTNIAVTIAFGYGELADGQYTVGSNAIAEALPNGGVSVSYAHLKTALAGSAASADDATALASLNGDPTSGGSFYVPGAEAKALGLESPNAGGIDGYVGISDAYSFSFDPNNRAAGGSFDAIGALEHEIAHALGRDAGLQADGPGQYYALDLFRYAGSGRRELVDGRPAYFSIDGGATSLNPFDASGGDSGDWAARVNGDSFGYGAPGEVGWVTRTDLREMDILGYTLNLPTDKVNQLLSAYSSAPALAYASIADTAADISAKLGALAPLTAPAIGAIYSIAVTDAASNFIHATAAQAVSDRPVLATIASPYSLAIALSGSLLTTTATRHLVNMQLTGTGNASVIGNGHNTFLVDNAGNDTIRGGGGTVIVNYSGIGTHSISAILSGGTGTVTKGLFGTDQLTGISGIVASNGTDKITVGINESAWAGNGSDVLIGTASNGGTDHLYAGTGQDTLTAGTSGTHYMTGGSGRDVYLTGGGIDYITAGSGTGIIAMAPVSRLSGSSSVFVSGFDPAHDSISLHLIGATAANLDSLVHLSRSVAGAVISTSVGGHAETVTLEGVNVSLLDLHSTEFLL